MGKPLKKQSFAEFKKEVDKFNGPTPIGTTTITETLKKEAVNSPSHYGGKDNPLEVINIIEHYNLDFKLGNSVKYILRAGKKDEILQELKKAQWYLNRKIDQLEHKALGEQIVKDYNANKVPTDLFIKRTSQDFFNWTSENQVFFNGEFEIISCYNSFIEEYPDIEKMVRFPQKLFKHWLRWYANYKKYDITFKRKKNKGFVSFNKQS